VSANRSQRSKGTPRNDGRNKRAGSIAHGAISFVIIAGIFGFIVPKFAPYSSVWRILRTLSTFKIGLLIGVTMLNIATYWPQMVAAMPGLKLAQAAVNNQASTSIANTLPGGGAIAVGVTYSMFRSWGFSNAAVALFTLITGVWNTFIKLGLPLVALAILAVEGDASRRLVAASLIGVAALAVSIALLVLVLRRESFAKKVGRSLGGIASFFLRIAGRRPVRGWDRKLAEFRERSIELVRRRWIPLTLTTLVSHLGLYLVLLVCLRETGVAQAEVSWAEALGVFAFARLVSAAPITPGGLGVVELSYIGGLVLAGGSRPEAVAGVLLFRALTFGLQIPLGPVAYLVWRRKKSWQKVPSKGRAGGRRAVAAAG
jgi:uncharacterized protein (TIRG00374 family)